MTATLAPQAQTTRKWVADLHALASTLSGPTAFREVCGTHTMSAFRCGLHSVMPDNVRLVSGPGCPVCVTAQGDIDVLIEAAELPGVTLCTYGDMIRVPGQRGSLEQARSRGADVRVVYSTLDAVRLARKETWRQVVFGAVGFETTAPATAAAILQAHALKLENFSVLASHKLVIPAMLALLEAGDVRVQGFMCPGHVSVIIGSDAYQPIVDKYRVPCVIAGFEPHQMAHAMLALTRQVAEGRADLENLYPEAVTPAGNRRAMGLIDLLYEPVNTAWRGIGVIPQSGLKLRSDYQTYDAAHRFGLTMIDKPEPAGCRCGDVITARITPPQCKLFGKLCTPINPVGPCMVSSEGTCQAYFKYHRLPISVSNREVAS
ncbi:MAG: hydrogenase formation protein HypD [Phycisphaeraceae bacterium]|nr:hydrogenase formation protein HypD [Phycisphaeraceae bacterium]